MSALAAILDAALASTRSLNNSITAEITISPDSTQPQLPQLAASSYLNSAPLIWSFLHGSRKETVNLTDPVPARCAKLLEDGAVEAALIPVIEYQRIPDVSLIPDVCVGSKGNVRSVVLVTRMEDLREVRSVALDESSRTSAALMKIIFLEFLGVEPKWVTSAPNIDLMLKVSDAALIIGDPAMTFARDGLRILDMAGLWREYTGLGFVFAVWAVSNKNLSRVADIDFGAARDEGLEQIEEILSHYEREIPLPREELKEYITDDITFHIDQPMQQGMKLYFDLAYKHRLIEQVKPLRFTDFMEHRMKCGI
jgi:chorismate dehydratase